MEIEVSGEKPRGGGKTPVGKMTLQQAISLGEYDPDYLANYPEWHALSRHVQFQMIRRALDIREHQLVVQWAEINNVIDFSKKPHLKKALRNLEDQRTRLLNDRERLYLEFTRV